MPALNATIVDNDVLEMRAICSMGLQVSYNVQFYKCTYTAGAGLTVQDAVDAWDASIAAAYKALLTQDAKYYGVMGRIANPTPNKSLYRFTKVNNGVGLVLSNAMSGQSCGMFTKLTGTPGQGGRGRIYVPFPAVGDNDAGGAPTAGYMVNLGILAAKYFAVLPVAAGGNTLSATPILFRRSAPLLQFVVLGATGRQKWATHKSRGLYGRTNALPF